MFNQKQFEEFIGKQKFRKAVTAKRNPHEYIVEYKTVNGTDEEFKDAVRFINDNGFKLMFWNREYTVYYLDGHMYWVIEDILNRNNVEDYTLVLSPKTGGKA